MMITAHSGCDGTPDNSTAYLRYALTLPIDAIELDIRRRSDGRLILWHDADPSGRYAGSLTLEEALAILRPFGGMLNCDLKEAGLEADVCRVHAQAHGGSLVLSGSVDPRLWGSRPDLQEQATVYLNAEEVVPALYDSLKEDPALSPAAGRTIARACLDCGARMVNLYHRACTGELLEILREQGIGASAWTVNDLERAKELERAGVANLTTRNAALFAHHFGAQCS